MKILFIASSNNPFTATQGSSQRSNLLLSACASCADVDVISFCTNNESISGNYQIIYQKTLPSNESESRLEKLRHLLTPWNPKTLYRIDRRRECVIDDFMRKKDYDYIVIRYIPQAISCGLMKYANKLIIDIDDNPIDKARNEALTAHSLRNKLYLRVYAMIMKVGLKSIVSRVNNVFFSNANQAKEWGKPFLPNIPFYDVRSTSSCEDEIKGRLLFIGDLGYNVNQDGITYFLQRIYPEIKKSHPEVTLHIVGRIWDENLKLLWEENEGVTVTGFVPSIIEEYQNCQVVIIPIYQGAGTCIKVLEAMQMSKPCVTTPIGFRGYNSFFKKDKDCFIAENDSEFIKLTNTLLENRAIRECTAQSANIQLQKYFTKNNFNKIVKDILL